MKRTALTLLTLTLLFAPMVNAVTIDGPTNFVGPAGGIVRYTTLITTRINIINTIWRLAGVNVGGVNMGALGADCSTGCIMTFTTINRNELRYTTNAGIHTQYIYYRGLAPSSVTGEITQNYDPVSGITTITTTGISTVRISYQKVSGDIRQTGINMASLIGLLAVILIFGGLGNQTMDLRTKMISYLIVLAAVMVMALIFANWGY